jgi:hypothetical protein
LQEDTSTSVDELVLSRRCYLVCLTKGLVDEDPELGTVLDKKVIAFPVGKTLIFS